MFARNTNGRQRLARRDNGLFVAFIFAILCSVAFGSNQAAIKLAKKKMDVAQRMFYRYQDAYNRRPTQPAKNGWLKARESFIAAKAELAAARNGRIVRNINNRVVSSRAQRNKGLWKGASTTRVRNRSSKPYTPKYVRNAMNRSNKILRQGNRQIKRNQATTNRALGRIAANTAKTNMALDMMSGIGPQVSNSDVDAEIRRICGETYTAPGKRGPGSGRSYPMYHKPQRSTARRVFPKVTPSTQSYSGKYWEGRANKYLKNEGKYIKQANKIEKKLYRQFDKFDRQDENLGLAMDTFTNHSAFTGAFHGAA